MCRRHPSLNREHRILTARDVMEILGCGQSKAYKIIRALNKELAAKGVLKESLIGGRVPEKYFYERVFFSGPPAQDGQSNNTIDRGVDCPGKDKENER